jgi:peptidoglycan hydrolase-like protein with peptidoglycan-binding domain
MSAQTFDPAVRMRRHRLRARHVAVAVASVAVLLPTAGIAQAATTGGSSSQASSSSQSSSLSLGSTGSSVKQLQRKLHVSASGYFGNETRTAVKHWQKRHGLKADGVAGPATLKALGISAAGASYSTGGASPSSGSSSSSGSTGGGSSVKLPPVLKRIAKCESGGNPRAISKSGRYRGKYQFDQATWEAAGGTGDPAAAPESTQDKIALKLYKARGTAPWPNCG